MDFFLEVEAGERGGGSVNLSYPRRACRATLCCASARMCSVYDDVVNWGGREGETRQLVHS